MYVTQVKNEVRQCVGHQLSCLRSREQQLLASLDSVVTLKDQLLTDQQDRLHQSLGLLLISCEQNTKHD